MKGGLKAAMLKHLSYLEKIYENFQVINGHVVKVLPKI